VAAYIGESSAHQQCGTATPPPVVSQTAIQGGQTAQTMQTTPMLKSQTDAKTTADAKKAEDDSTKNSGSLNTLKEDLNKQLSSLGVYAKFGFDDKTGSMYVSVYSQDSNQLIRQMPSAEAMKMADNVKELMGSILNKKT